MVSYLYRMPAGVPGQVTRLEHSTIEPQAYDTTAPFSAYGVPAKIGPNSGRMQPVGAGDVAAAVYGLLVRPYPTTGAASQTSVLGVGAPPTFGGVCNILRRGYMMVQVNGTTAAVKGGQVFIRVANAATGKPVGGFEAAADISVTGTATTGNTGNGTMSTLSAQSSTPPGTYVAVFTAATKYNVTDPSGAILGSGTAGAQLTLDNGLSLKITAGGTAFIANDSFSIVVADNTIAPALPAIFTGPADANGNTEIGFNI